MPKSWVKQKLIEAGIPAKDLKGLAKQLSEFETQLDVLGNKLGKEVVESFFFEDILESPFGDRNQSDNLRYSTQLAREMSTAHNILPPHLFRKDPISRLRFLNALSCGYGKSKVAYTPGMSYEDLKEKNPSMARAIYLITTPAGLELIRIHTDSKRGLNMGADNLREGLRQIMELEEKKEENTLDGLLAKHGNLKRVIYKRDRDTISHLESLGVNYTPFSNLSDPQIVASAVDKLNAEKADPFYGVAVQILRQKGIELTTLSTEDVRVYSDEVALGIDEAIKKRPSAANKFADLEDHVKSAFSRGNVSFRYSTRSDEDRKLGDKCGDCTAKGGLNADKVDSWLADSLYQQMSLFYGTKFMGRMNLAVVQSSDKPMVLIDAIEFIPQAREVDKYSEMARTALKEGIEKVKQIADSMGINQIAAYTFSNSEELTDALEEVGYSSERRHNISSLRQKSIQEAMGVERGIPYFLQAMERSGEGFERSITDMEKMRKFESILNEGILKDEAKKNQLANLVRSGDMNTAASAIVQYDLLIGDSFLYRTLGMGQEEVSKGLRFLYGQTSLTDKSRVKLTTIRKEKVA
ncbi:hypothetical protein FJZ21_01685 [Candidatus Pacearchaeota archaeon]|nr:hypothetical protein [Candidatus Pacearchaeota archaeon]